MISSSCCLWSCCCCQSPQFQGSHQHSLCYSLGGQLPRIYVSAGLRSPREGLLGESVLGGRGGIRSGGRGICFRLFQPQRAAAPLAWAPPSIFREEGSTVWRHLWGQSSRLLLLRTLRKGWLPQVIPDNLSVLEASLNHSGKVPLSMHGAYAAVLGIRTWTSQVAPFKQLQV